MLRNQLKKIGPKFQGNGKYERFYPLFEMIDTFFTNSQLNITEMLYWTILLAIFYLIVKNG